MLTFITFWLEAMAKKKKYTFFIHRWQMAKSISRREFYYRDMKTLNFVIPHPIVVEKVHIQRNLDYPAYPTDPINIALVEITIYLMNI